MIKDQHFPNENMKSLHLHRKLLGFFGLIYVLWWFAVEALLPDSFNPIAGRLVVAGTLWFALGISYFNAWVRRHMQLVLAAGNWLITVHFFYLFFGNSGDINWVVGCYITVIAISLSFFSTRALLYYSFFVLALSFGVLYLLPSLRNSVFLPGLMTILIQAYVGLRSRLSVIRDLSESNQRFQMLFNSTFEGVIVHKNGIILDVNESLTLMLGYTRKELIGMKLLDLVELEERARVGAQIQVREIFLYETRALTKDQRVIDIEVRAKDFVYDNDPSRLVTVRDISDRKQVEKERVAALALVENLRQRDDFISIASHELKTPISAIRLQVNLLERLFKKEENPKHDDSLKLLNRQIDRLSELVETMLDVSQISAGKFILNKEKVDLTETVGIVIETMSVQRNAKVGLSSIELHAPDSLFLWADRSRLQQVVENLVSNAIKYGDGKPVVIRIQPEADNVRLEVEDHGLGIAAEATDRIFDRFERAISARNITGFGLGLYIVRQIVEAHGGDIRVKSSLGKGSVFIVRLPLA